MTMSKRLKKYNGDELKKIKDLTCTETESATPEILNRFYIEVIFIIFFPPILGTKKLTMITSLD